MLLVFGLIVQVRQILWQLAKSGFQQITLHLATEKLTSAKRAGSCGPRSQYSSLGVHAKQKCYGSGTLRIPMRSALHLLRC